MTSSTCAAATTTTQECTFTFTVPAGVSLLNVELYGAGGGGTIARCTGGSGGGGGAYTSTILSMQAGQTLTISVGIGGSPSGSSAMAGGDGGPTKVLDANGNVLAVAQGGSGGLPYPSASGFGGCGIPVLGAAGGAADSTAMISHAGASAPAVLTGIGGGGYQVPGFPCQPNGVFGGGGAGAIINGPAQAGQGGYVFISW